MRGRLIAVDLALWRGVMVVDLRARLAVVRRLVVRVRIVRVGPAVLVVSGVIWPRKTRDVGDSLRREVLRGLWRNRWGRSGRRCRRGGGVGVGAVAAGAGVGVVDVLVVDGGGAVVVSGASVVACVVVVSTVGSDCSSVVAPEATVVVVGVPPGSPVVVPAAAMATAEPDVAAIARPAAIATTCRRIRRPHLCRA